MSTPRPRPAGAGRVEKATQPQSPAGGDGGPVRVDAALRQTVALLELVRQEEALLGWLDDCVAQLHAVRRARQTLIDLTDAELAEARVLVAGEDSRTGRTAQGTADEDPAGYGGSEVAW